MGAHFVDEAVIVVRSGKGGNGCCSFLREKFVPRGGPNGGDGGRGGHVILRTSSHVTTLLDIGRRHLYAAEDGRPGEGRNSAGRKGRDLVLELPVGTQLRRRGTGALVADLDRLGMELVIARGGSGGRGNKAFATATHQAPREWEPGGAGEEIELALELKLMADVGLLGLPNAGKSTFLARVSAARPRIADYPFTTLAPQLGIAELGAERRLVVADIPGIIEGAHEGVGLGLEFLRHLSRTRAIVHLLDPHDRSEVELVEDFRVIRCELERYSAELARRTLITAINKIDLVPASDRAGLIEGFERRVGERVHAISAATGEGVPALLDACWRAARE